MDVLSSIIENSHIEGNLALINSFYSSWGLKFNSNKCMGFHIISQGSCFLKIKGHYKRVQKGDLIFIPKGIPHELCSSLNENTQDIKTFKSKNKITKKENILPIASLICVEYSKTKELHPFFSNLPDYIIFESSQISNNHPIHSTLLLLSKELEKEKISDLIIHKLSDILLYDILENWISKQITNEPGWVKVFEDELILNAIQILHSNLKIPWNMEKFSLEIKISKNELVQRFLNSLGIRPMEYLNYIRIEKGKSLLLKSSLGLEEIAKETGFLNKNAFSRAYKKKTGISPSKVRSGKL